VVQLEPLPDLWKHGLECLEDVPRLCLDTKAQPVD